ncbi:MAG TPA: hypothetical protein EYH34_06965, partial [Planctomycetes bacterium]|nr:hypothetical protein [Planctomycetota bacterium]
LENRDTHFKQITGKTKEPPKAGPTEKGLLQSVVHVMPAHRIVGGRAEAPPQQPDSEKHSPTELRQGVGIRQATGATAAERKALFDLEAVPAGTKWEFFLEIDTLRGGPEVERLVLLAVAEWAQGRCWLGGSAARGTGWMNLENVELLRLPLTEKAVDAWPNNMFASNDQRWDYLIKLPGTERAQGKEGLRSWAEQTESPVLPDNRFWYLRIDAQLEAGPAASGYGLDALSVGGHAAALIQPLSDNLLTPNGVNAESFRGQYNPHAPVVVTRRANQPRDQAEPLVPGSGIRGPLRHATSRWLRGQPGDNGKGPEIPDPNDPSWDTDRDSDDSVSQLFGLTKRSARLLVRDGLLVRSASSDDPASPLFQLALFQHHAEDEFAGGAYGAGKFDRTAVIVGTFEVRLVIEAQAREELMGHLKTLTPALQLAELGHLPIGGAKWRGFGWLPWRFTRVELWRAGSPDPEPRRALRNPEKQDNWIVSAIAELQRSLQNPNEGAP